MTDKPMPVRPVMRRRQRILQTARDLFTERGFEAVGIREIAEQAGVSKSLINRHFESKEGLRAQVDQQVMAEFEQLLDVILAPDKPLDDPDRASAERAQRLNAHLSEVMPLLLYLRHSLLENSDAGHAMFRAYVDAAARSLRLPPPDYTNPAAESRLWLVLSVMFLQLGPIFLEPHITALTGRGPFTPQSVTARSQTYARIDAKLREILREFRTLQV